MGLCLCQVSATESTLRLNTGDAVSAAYYFDQHRGSNEGKGICFCSAALAFVGMGDERNNDNPVSFGTIILAR